MAQALVEAKAEIDNEKCKDSVKSGKTKKQRNKNKHMSRCEDSPEYKRMYYYKDVRDKEHKELHRDVKNM